MGLIGVEVLRGSDLRTDEQGSRLDHSHCNPFVAVDMTVAVREHFAFDIDFGIVPGIVIAGRGTVPGCIEADTLQWESSPLAGRQNWVVSGPQRNRCWPELVGKPTEGRWKEWWGTHVHLWVCSSAHCYNWLRPYHQNSGAAFYSDPSSSLGSVDLVAKGVLQWRWWRKLDGKINDLSQR